MKQIVGLLLACIAVISAVAGTVQAETIAFNFTDPSSGDVSAEGTDGFRFTPIVNILAERNFLAES